MPRPCSPTPAIGECRRKTTSPQHPVPAVAKVRRQFLGGLRSGQPPVSVADRGEDLRRGWCAQQGAQGKGGVPGRGAGTGDAQAVGLVLPPPRIQAGHRLKDGVTWRAVAGLGQAAQQRADRRHSLPVRRLQLSRHPGQAAPHRGLPQHPGRVPLVARQQGRAQAHRPGRRHKDIAGRQPPAAGGEVNRLIPAVIQLGTQLPGERPEIEPGPPRVQARQPEVDHARVHVQPVRVDRRPAGQQHRLRDQRIDALVLIKPQHRQPHPAPRRQHRDSVGMGPQPAPGRAGQRIIHRHAQNPQRDISQHRHKQRPRRLAMQRPRPITTPCHLVMAQDLATVTLRQRPSAHHPAGQHVLREQHGVPPHLAFPAPRRILLAQEVRDRSGQRPPSRSPAGDGSRRPLRHERPPPHRGLSAAGPARTAVPEPITTNAIVAVGKARRHSAAASPGSAGSSMVMPGPVLLLYCAGCGCQPGRMRPTVRYCATPAGRVAYSTSGAGPALLFDSGWITHLRGQLELFSFGSFIERLAERFTVIRYDKPGCGLSDRDGIDLSFDGQVAAALAVADAVGAGRFRLFGASQGRSARRRDRGEVPGPGRGAGAVRDVRQRQGPGACRGPGLGRGAGAGPLGPGAEGAGRGVRHRSHG